MLVHRAPAVLQLPFDLQEHLIEVPGITRLRPAPAEFAGELTSKSKAPLPDALVGDGDTPFGENQFNVPEAQAEKVVQPDGMADDLGWEAVPGVGGALGRHLKKPGLKVMEHVGIRSKLAQQQRMKIGVNGTNARSSAMQRLVKPRKPRSRGAEGAGLDGAANCRGTMVLGRPSQSSLTLRPKDRVPIYTRHLAIVANHFVPARAQQPDNAE